MASKPSTIPNRWASDALYSSGPFIGDVCKVDPGAGIAGEGHRPGSLLPTAAEHENYQQNQVTTWVIDWLSLGSSAGAADAHIVETNSAGRATLAGLTVNDLADEVAVAITGANTLAPTLYVTCLTGATAIQANIGASDGRGFFVEVGIGRGTGFNCDLTNSPGGAYGVDVNADAGTLGTCIRSSHAGVGYALDVSSTGLFPAINAVAGLTASAVADISGGNTYALGVVSGTPAGADAIRASTSSVAGAALRAITSLFANSSGRAVFASGLGSAVGGEFISTANHAIIATGDTTSPVYGALKITETNARPTDSTVGQVAIVRPAVGVASQLMTSCPEDGGWRGHLSTSGGSALSHAYDAGPIVVIPASWTLLTPFLSINGDAPKAAGTALVRISFSLRITTDPFSLYLGLRILDITAGGGTIWTRSGSGTGAGAGWRYEGDSAGINDWRPQFSITVPIAIPAAGGRLWNLEALVTSSSNVEFRDISVDYLGML